LHTMSRTGNASESSSNPNRVSPLVARLRATRRSSGLSPARMRRVIAVLTVAVTYIPPPKGSPIAAKTHTLAAVVTPRTTSRSCGKMITPAPRKPMPLMPWPGFAKGRVPRAWKCQSLKPKAVPAAPRPREIRLAEEQSEDRTRKAARLLSRDQVRIGPATSLCVGDVRPTRLLNNGERLRVTRFRSRPVGHGDPYLPTGERVARWRSGSLDATLRLRRIGLR